MWPFSKKEHYPGVKENPDGTIEFSLTDEEAREADLALRTFEGVLVHPEAAERVRSGTIAVALSHYARDLVNTHCVGLTEEQFSSNWSGIRSVLIKAVAAVWKSFSLCPLPIFLYYRAAFLQMLGLGEQSRYLFALFLKKHSEFRAGQIDKLLMEYEGGDIAHALSHAKRAA